MWLGREVVVAGLPPLMRLLEQNKIRWGGGDPNISPPPSACLELTILQKISFSFL